MQSKSQHCSVLFSPTCIPQDPTTLYWSVSQGGFLSFQTFMLFHVADLTSPWEVAQKCSGILFFGKWLGPVGNALVIERANFLIVTGPLGHAICCLGLL